MIEINPTLWKIKPYEHQVYGVRMLVKNQSFALFDEMGAGKSAQVINAACTLFNAGEIDCVLIVSPASVRSVWLNPEFGEIKKHCWVPSLVCEYHQKNRIVWSTSENGAAPLTWIVTNYEYVRPINEDVSRRDSLGMLLNNYNKVLLVLDESSAVKSSRSGQFSSMKELRKACGRCVILNGTPVPNNPLDLWAQIEILDKDILGYSYKNFYHFRYSHCNFGGWKGKQIIGWKDLGKVQSLIAPYCVRRLKKDCLDLPPKIGGIDAETPIIREVALTEKTWTLYRRLRTEAILALPEREERLEANAAVRLMRLAQLTSGHVSVPGAPPDSPQSELWVEPEMEDVSDEKLKYTTEYLSEWSTAEASIVWCRWRRERERLVKMLLAKGLLVFQLYGGQKKSEGDLAKNAFNPSRRGTGRRVLVAQPHAGGKGLDLCAATEGIYQSNDHSLEYRLQSEDRNHRSGTLEPITYLEILATGPKGQKTIDHIILKVLRAKQDLATLTCAAWRRELVQEQEEG